MHPSDEKTQLRLAVGQRVAHLTQKEREAESRSLCRRLLGDIPENAVVCAYMPMQSEADIRPLLRDLTRQGNAIFLPCFENGALLFRKMTEEERLRKGVLGVLEPPPDAPQLAAEKVDVVLVPGRAFDAAGNRLGRGNGGYDRWIRERRRQNSKTRFIGVALECQMTGNIPTEPHDERMDAVATARGVKQVRITNNK